MSSRDPWDNPYTRKIEELQRRVLAHELVESEEIAEAVRALRVHRGIENEDRSKAKSRKAEVRAMDIRELFRKKPEPGIPIPEEVNVDKAEVEAEKQADSAAAKRVEELKNLFKAKQ